MRTGVTSSWKKDSSAYDNTTTSISVDNRNQGTSTYNATITPNPNSWCVGNSITLNYYIQVCPWKIALNTEDENTNLTNLTGNTEYTLSATNEADTTSTVTWSSNNTRFTINNNKLTTPQASTESDLTATITAIVDDVTIGTITVIVKQLGSQANPFTNWTDLCEYLSKNLTDDTTIYVQGEEIIATETATVNRPVTIIPVGEVTITLYDNFSEQLFTVNADLTLKGYDASNQFTINGDGYELEVPLISTDNSDITLEYVKMQNYMNTPENNSNPAGGAISFNCTDKTLSLINCNFTDVITTIMPNEEFKTQIGAIYFGNGTLILDNCSFTDEYAHLYCYPDDTSKITLKGNITLPIIQYANAFTYWNGDLQITLEEDTFQSDEIKIYVDNIIDEYDTKLFTLNGAELPKCFKLLNEGYEFNYEDGTITEATTGGNGGTQLRGTSVTSASDLKSKIENGTDSVIIIASDIEITETINVTRNVQIAANSNVTITQNISSSELFNIADDVSFTIGGGSEILTIKGNSNSKGNVIYSKGNVTIKDNIYFTESYANNGVIYIYTGTLNMEGGKIYNNSANAITSNMGGGDVVINISGGEICNNTKNNTNYGSAIYVINSSYYKTTLNIYGNAKIHDNYNNNGYAINIIDTDSTLYINYKDHTPANASLYDNYQGDTNLNASIYIASGYIYYLSNPLTGCTPYTLKIPNDPNT